MILARLIQYYQYLRQIGQDTAIIPPYGFSEEKIGAVLILSTKGKLVDIHTHAVVNHKNQLKPQPLIVPRSEKRTSGIQPNFLWDKSSYVLGVEHSLEMTEAKTSMFTINLKLFNAFRQYHISLLNNTTDVGLRAVRLFLQQWQPAMFAELSEQQQKYALNMNLVFMLENSEEYIHQRPAVFTIWLHYLRQQNPVWAKCLTDGMLKPMAVVHPLIKHIHAASGVGVSLISFNQNAFTSYGKKQGHNAPIATTSAFAYTTALHYLLSQNSNHCVRIADTSIVFWVHGVTTPSVYRLETLFRQIIMTDDSKAFPEDLYFRHIEVGAVDQCDSTRFCVLGLIPNAARLAVRFWFDSRVAELEQHLMLHKQEWRTYVSSGRRLPSVMRLVRAIVPDSQLEQIPVKLLNDIIVAILSGQNYPINLLSLLLARIRTDRGRHKLTMLRVAMIQAILQRRHHHGLLNQPVPMQLDQNNHECAYVLGRLFALLAYARQQAVKHTFTDITDCYYAMACATPHRIFPRLMQMCEHQWLKLISDTKVATYIRLLLTQLLLRLPAIASLPVHLDLIEQGQFTLGYDHQKRAGIKI